MWLLTIDYSKRIIFGAMTWPGGIENHIVMRCAIMRLYVTVLLLSSAHLLWLVNSNDCLLGIHSSVNRHAHFIVETRSLNTSAVIFLLLIKEKHLLEAKQQQYYKSLIFMFFVD